MKRNKQARRMLLPPVAIIALLLTAIVIVTTPLALTKYAAVGSGVARARLAKWQPEFHLTYSRQTPSGVLNKNVLNGGGYVLHPGVWAPSPGWDRFFHTHFYFYNYSETATIFQYEFMSYADLDSLESHGGLAVGEYVHNTRTKADASNFGANIGAGGAWVPFPIYMDWSTHNSGLRLPNNGDGGATGSHLAFQPPLTNPIRPNGSINSAGTVHNGNTNSTNISQADPIRFGVGENSISGMNTKWWRTYRLNVDLVATQVD